MAQIHNSDLSKEIRDGIKLQQLSDVIPSQLADKVVPVMEVNPKLLRRCNVVKSYTSTATGAGSTAIFTLPSGRDFYLIGFTISLSKNAACDVATGSYALTGSVDGISTVIARIAFTTLQVCDVTLSFAFPEAVKIDAGNLTSGAFAFTVGASSRAIAIYGYLVDNPTA
jgi:hypothetical protein